MSTEATLSSLHGALADDLLRRVRSGEATAAELAVAVKFLKDNHIDCEPSANKQMQSLLDEVLEQAAEDVEFM